ncbi:hypothetical protein OKW38_005180 [Paraburkholderia sp. MM5496-R1]|uniref:hypothetical protein n=1 Tax=Paraburkholderia sp. MM5496-R1 TaxID=2991065 RepID=UPI003D208E10
MSADTHESCPYQLHSSLRLYAMVNKPLDAPSVSPGSHYCGDMQMLCHRTDHGRMICTYLSPLDAILGSMDLHDDEDHFWPIDFRCVDTRHFLEQNGSLNVSVNYAFAADRGRIVVGKRAQPIMVYTGDAFEIPREQWDHFSIRFTGRVVDRIEDILTKAGLSNFAETLEAMDGWSTAQIHDAVEQAIARMPPTIAAEELGKSSMDQCAIYDPESGDWHFVDFD